MIKKYKRIHSNWMRRSSRIYLNCVNKGKIEQLKQSLQRYANVVNYFIEFLWSKSEFSSSMNYTDAKRAVDKFSITARLASACYKQAKEIVNSQIKKSRRKRRMPIFRNIVANLDYRFFTITEFVGRFDWALKLQSGFPKIIIPFNNTKHTNKLLKNGWQISKAIRIGIDEKKRVFIDLIFEKPRPPKRDKGEVIGLDIGYRALCATFDGKTGRLYGEDLKNKIQKAGKRRKSFHHFIATEANRIIKQIPLDNVKTIAIEDLKYVKYGKRGKFSRKVNRLLSFWHYARVINRIKQICEEEGIRVEEKSPAYTSQRCPDCGKIDRRNRKKDKFCCINCGFQNHADIVGAMNLRFLSMAGVYSPCSLKKAECG